MKTGKFEHAADAANHKLRTPPTSVSRTSGSVSSPAATTFTSAPNHVSSSPKLDYSNSNTHRMASVPSTEDGELRPLVSMNRSKDILATLIAQNLARRRANPSGAPALPHPPTIHQQDGLQSEDRSAVARFLDGGPSSQSLCRQFIEVVGRVGEEMETLRKRRVDVEKYEASESTSNPSEMASSLPFAPRLSMKHLLPIDKDSQALIDLLYTPSPKTQRDDLPNPEDQGHVSSATFPPDNSPRNAFGPSAEMKTNHLPTIRISPPVAPADVDISPAPPRVGGTAPEPDDMVISPHLPPRSERLTSPPVDMELDSSDDDGGAPDATQSKPIAVLDSSATVHASDMTAVVHSDHEDGSIESSDESSESNPEEGQLLDSVSSTPTLDMFLHLPEERDDSDVGDVYSTLRPILDVLRTNGEALSHSELLRSPGNGTSFTETAGRKDVPGVWASAQCLSGVGQRPLVFRLSDEMGAQWGARRRGQHHPSSLDEPASENTSLDLGLGPVLVPVVESDEDRKRSRKAGKGEESEEPKTEYSHLQVELACVQLKDVETIWETFAPQFAEFAPPSREGLKAKSLLSDTPNRSLSKRSRIALETAFVEALSQLKQQWPQPGELLVLINDDVDLAREMGPLAIPKTQVSPHTNYDGQGVFLGRDFVRFPVVIVYAPLILRFKDPSKPIPLATHIRQGPNTIRIIQLSPLAGCVFVVFSRGSRQGGFISDHLTRKEKKRKSHGGDGEALTNAKDKQLNDTTIRRAVNVGWLD